MKVDWEQTNRKCEGDRKFFFTTEEREPITLFKVCEMINLLAHNEWKIKNANSWNRYLFQEAISGSIEHAKKGINWDDKSNRLEIRNLCTKTHMRFEEPSLNNITQLKLEDFVK